VIEYAKQKIGDLNCVHAAHRDATGKPDAVVILCHGFGAPGADLVPIASELILSTSSLANVRFIFPEAPIELDPNYDSRAWWMIDIERIQLLMITGETRAMQKESPERLPVCNAAINKIIEFSKSEFGVKSTHLVVGGFSQGAMLTTDVALSHPERLGGLIVWSGSLINEDVWRQAAEKQTPLDIVQSHGRVDPILPFAGGELLRDLFRETNHNVQFIEFNGQHGIPQESIDAAQKLIERVVAHGG